jgi:hypothetical protein
MHRVPATALPLLGHPPVDQRGELTGHHPPHRGPSSARRHAAAQPRLQRTGTMTIFLLLLLCCGSGPVDLVAATTEGKHSIKVKRSRRNFTTTFTLAGSPASRGPGESFEVAGREPDPGQQLPGESQSRRGKQYYGDGYVASGIECSSQNSMFRGISFITGICCTQLGASCPDGSPFPADCNNPICARAIRQVSSACIPWLQTNPMGGFLASFREQFQKLNAQCTAALPETTILLSDTDQHVTRDACGAQIIDGRAESNSQWKDTLAVTVGLGLRAQIVIDSFWLPDADVLVVYDGNTSDARQLVRLRGTLKPTQPISASGPALFLQMLSDGASVGLPVGFSLRIVCLCNDDATCGVSQLSCIVFSVVMKSKFHHVHVRVPSGHGKCVDQHCECEGGYTYGPNMCDFPEYYTVTGVVNSAGSSWYTDHFNGLYTRSENMCHGKPVWVKSQDGGQTGSIIYWAGGIWAFQGIGCLSECCQDSYYIYNRGADCGTDATPDDPGCATRWYQNNANTSSHWLSNSDLSVCPGRTMGETGIGAHCASAFTVSGTTKNGLYAESGHVCNGKPVYQNSDTGNVIIYYNAENWRISDSSAATSCYASAWYISAADCRDSPDGSGCVGKWKQYGNSWTVNPNVSVVALEQPRLLE